MLKPSVSQICRTEYSLCNISMRGRCSDGFNPTKSMLFLNFQPQRQPSNKLLELSDPLRCLAGLLIRGGNRDATFSTTCCFHFESCCSLRLCRLQSSAWKLSPLSASSTTSVLNSGVYLLRFRFAIGILLSMRLLL